MKCISKCNYLKRMFSITILGILLFSVLTGCGQIQKYEIPYTADSEVSSFRVIEFTNEKNTADPFAKDLCVSESNYRADAIDLSNASGGALFDVNNHETIYAKNIYEKLAPASLTKVLTAVVALKNASEDTLLTATSNVKITESGAQVCGLKEGDQLTLSQALHLLLINSANDAAVLIAEGVGGTVENFCEMMNEEALALGATNSHFVNPHGLTDDNHYTTVYDMYLIMNVAIKFEVFREIIHMDSYTTVYHDKNGAEKEITVNSTNYYFIGKADPPSGITILGGKTGTTDAAGHCLVLLSRDTQNKPYISVIMRSDARENLYISMSELLAQIGN